MAAFDYYAIIDFEASGAGPQSTEWEIVEFPIVLVDAHTLRRLPDEFHRYVRPTTNAKLSKQCIQTCGIEQAVVDSASPISEVVAEAISWVESYCLGKTYAVVTCGDYDLGTALRVESQRKEFHLPIWLCRWVNIKVPFTNRFGRPTGMKGMLSRLGLFLSGHHHCGLDDARNIANIVIEFLKWGAPLHLTGSYEPDGSVQINNPSFDGELAQNTQALSSTQPARRRWGKPAPSQGTRSESHRPDKAFDGYGEGSCGASLKLASQTSDWQDFGPARDSMPMKKEGSIKRAHAPVRIDEPWLSWIVSGVKTHEGRLCRGTWAKLAPGHQLIAYSERYAHVELMVRNIIHFDDFDAAFARLGKCLVPEGAETPQDALHLYRLWHSADAVQKSGGVVAVEVKVGKVCFR